MEVLDESEETSSTAMKFGQEENAEKPKWFGRWWGYALVAVISVVTCMMWPLIRGERVPTVHDENSYILAAETFAAGRFANPPHPMREHFLTYHEIFEPTYMSKYPPGQGMCLALGLKLTGNLAAGIWIGVALMAVAMTWMLRAWLPASWAVAGGLIIGVAFGGASDWGRTFWGGALAATGGAMLLGALMRLKERPTLAVGAMLGGGICLLALTRPFEGAVFTAAICPLMAISWKGAGKEFWRWRFRSLAAAGCVLAAYVSFQLVYNRAVTGSYTKMPYALYCENYDAVPIFTWKPQTPLREYPFAEMNMFLQSELNDYKRAGAQGPFRYAVTIWQKFGEFFFKRLAFLPLVGVVLSLIWMWRKKETVAVLGAFVIAVTAQSAVVFYFPHYSAPSLAALALLSIWGFWSLWQSLRKRGWKTPQWMPVGVITLVAIGAPASMAAVISTFPKLPAPKSFEEFHGDINEKPFVAKLISQASDHRALVFVQYLKDHVIDHEWVFNAADIDASPVIWARSGGEAFDRELMEYYKKIGQSRQAWRLTLGPAGTNPIVERIELK